MKKILSISLVLMLAFTTAVAQDVINNKDKPEYLYVLSAKSGSFDDGTLTLNDVPMVIYFSDRPYRIAGHISLKKFVDLWREGSDSFKADPPNATLSIFDEQGNKDVVLEISNLQLKENTLAFKIHVLEGNTPKSFGPSSLFIDEIVFPPNVYSMGALPGYGNFNLGN